MTAEAARQGAAPRPKRSFRITYVEVILWSLRILILVVVVGGTIGTLIKGRYTRLINFAHGDITMTGAFSAFFLARHLDRTGFLDAYPLLSMLAITALAMVVCSVIALAVERICYRPFRHVATLAGIPLVQPMVIGTALAAMLLLYLVVQKTKMGTAMRAVSEDRDAAAMMGIDVNKVIIFTFILGGCMAGIGGVLYAMVYKQVYFFMGFLPGIKAFSAAVLGGIGNIPGAMIGGFFLGIVESVGPALFLDGIGIKAPYQLRDLIAFTMLVMVLIFRPQGILGERLAAKRA
jgi:branched-chain amino acid transport system permease protein